MGMRRTFRWGIRSVIPIAVLGDLTARLIMTARALAQAVRLAWFWRGVRHAH